MKYGALVARIEVLEEVYRPDKLGPWPPESGISKIVYDQLLEHGIEAQRPPDGQSGLIYLLGLTAKDAFRGDIV